MYAAWWCIATCGWLCVRRPKLQPQPQPEALRVDLPTTVTGEQLPAQYFYSPTQSFSSLEKETDGEGDGDGEQGRSRWSSDRESDVGMPVPQPVLLRRSGVP